MKKSAPKYAIIILSLPISVWLSWAECNFPTCTSRYTFAIIQVQHSHIKYYFIFLSMVFASCNLRMTECKDIQEWKIEKYRFVKSDCLRYTGPRFYPISVYIGDEKQAGNASQVDSCVFSWQADNERFLTFNVCEQTIHELSPHKIELDINSIDSVTMLSNETKETKRLTIMQIEQFVTNFNNSKTRGYYPEEPFDSAFNVLPAYQYRLTVFSKGIERPFYCYNYVILDSSNWKYEMGKEGELDYFHKYWNK